MKRYNCYQILQTSSMGNAMLDVCTTGELNKAAHQVMKIISFTAMPLLVRQYINKPVLEYCHLYFHSGRSKQDYNVA
jgi:hypothetical protein